MPEVSISPPGTARLVFSQVLTVDTATLDTGANVIPATGSVLEVFALLRTDEAAVFSNVQVAFNTDTGNSYSATKLQNVNSTVTGATNASSTLAFDCAAASTTAGVVSPTLITAPGYALTTFHKAGYLRSGFADGTTANSRIAEREWRWANTAAINELTLSITTGAGQKFKAGSAMWVYVR